MKAKQIKNHQVRPALIMVIPAIIILLSAFTVNVTGQNPVNTKSEISVPPPSAQKCGSSDLPVYMVYGIDTIYIKTKDEPEFPGGSEALKAFKAKNVKYPAEIKKTGIEGTVRVNFNVKKDGSLSNVRVVEGVSPSLDAEALRVTRLMPRWQPGTESGKPVEFFSGTTYDFELIPGKKPGANNEGCTMVAKKSLPNENDEEPFVVVEEMPVFPGGDEALLKFIAENVKYPESGKTNNVQGRVIVRFCVAKDGIVNKVSIIRGVDPELDAEAIRVVNLLPAFTPGKQSGKTVPVWYMIPITFTLKDLNKEKVPAAKKQDLTGYDESPVFQGGEEAIYKFIASNINYPESAKAQYISGKVIVNFCIGNNGSIEVANIYKGINPDLNAEAVRVIKLLPAWQPAKLSGVPVSVWYKLPVSFVLK